jgi:hypothetical protein
MNQKSINKIAHVTTLFIEKHNVLNLASDEDSVLVSKLIIELYTSMMSTSEWWLNKGTMKTAEQLDTILSIRTIRTIWDGGSKNNTFCDKNLLMIFNVHKSIVKSKICIHLDEMQSRIQLKIDYILE